MSVSTQVDSQKGAMGVPYDEDTHSGNSNIEPNDLQMELKQSQVYLSNRLLYDKSKSCNPTSLTISFGIWPDRLFVERTVNLGDERVTPN